MEGAGAGNGKPIPDPAVPERPVRRRFTAEYKLRILREADRSPGPGQLGALLRREGLYSSHLTTWRKQREEGTLAGLRPKRRGRKANGSMMFRRAAFEDLDRDHIGRHKRQGNGPRGFSTISTQESRLP
jgi:transposase-like protein